MASNYSRPGTRETDLDLFGRVSAGIIAEVRRVIVGQDEVLNGALVGLLTSGHVLLEGVPGLGKTRLVRALASALDLAYSRVQFTPDLMPADITGTNIIADDPSGTRRFRFEPGPVFANLLLADEVNRATPKTQSALLEAMAESQVTVANIAHRLPEPFMVLATQNPLEMEGTYPLPEAQLDRFAYKILVTFPTLEELNAILDLTTGDTSPTVTPVASAPEILRLQSLIRQVPMGQHVRDYVARLVLGTHPDQRDATRFVKQYVRFGASPRAGQALILAGKVYALLDGRYNVGFEDIRRAAHIALRHRLLLNFEAEADGISTDSVIEQLVMTLRTDEMADRGRAS
ncbi:MAG: MoxR family ATPase [Chloroflexi bacterium]|nr:MoxR family ATPase [Chloroflexota bacterium]